VGLPPAPELGDRVRPGERRHAVAVATNLRQARLFVRAALSVVERSPILAGLVEAVTEDEILFRNSTALSAFPCTSRGARGWPISTLLLDEAAWHVDTDGNSAAERVFSSLVPATAQFAGEARVIVSSTVWGDSGFFADLHQRAAAGEFPDAQAQLATTREVNPTIPDEFLEHERLRNPEAFAAEYESVFTGGGGAFFDPQRLADAGLGWVVGLDLGVVRDPTGVVVVGREPSDPDRLVVGAAHRWGPAERPDSFEERRLAEAQAGRTAEGVDPAEGEEGVLAHAALGARVRDETGTK
jgi:hypothetical protein